MKIRVMIGLIVALVIATAAAGQDKTPAELYGQLFEDVQMRRVFPDGKTFVDAVPRDTPAIVMQRYQDGSWKPYTHDELLHVLTEAFRLTPEYCRLTRVIRDIPSTDIVVGNQMTNFRQVVENELAKHGERSPDIRAREVRFQQIKATEFHLDELWYTSSCSDELFLQYIASDRSIAGFLRLSLPKEPAITDELTDAAMIREVHVYGQSVEIGDAASGRAQHAGLGTQLIERAAAIAREHGYQRLAVISAIGTREYYGKRGFEDGVLYQHRTIPG